jgi:hypothetical protein
METKVDKVETEVRYDVRLNLSQREMEILTALTDLPDWESQASDVRDFLTELNESLSYQSGVCTPAYRLFTNDITV